MLICFNHFILLYVAMVEIFYDSSVDFVMNYFYLMSCTIFFTFTSFTINLNIQDKIHNKYTDPEPFHSICLYCYYEMLCFFICLHNDKGLLFIIIIIFKWHLSNRYYFIKSFFKDTQLFHYYKNFKKNICHCIYCFLIFL